MILTELQGQQIARQATQHFMHERKHWIKKSAIRHLHKLLTAEKFNVSSDDDGVTAYNTDGSVTRITILKNYEWKTERRINEQF